MNEALGLTVEEMERLYSKGCPKGPLPAIVRWLEEQKATPEEKLAKKVRSAGGPAELAEIVKEALALCLEGKLGPRAVGVKALLVEAREALAAVPKDVADGQLLCTEEAAVIVRLFEGIVNGERRKAVLAFVEKMALEDEADFPDGANGRAIRAKLTELGLDAFGEKTV